MHSERSTRRARLLSWLVPAILMAGPAAAQQADADWLADCEGRSRGDGRFTHCAVQVERIPATGGAVTVDTGPNGGVLIQGWDRPDIEIHARVQARSRSQERARELAEGVRIAHAGVAIRAEGPSAGPDENLNVGFVVYVPTASDLRLETRNGPLTIEGVDGRMELRSQNGPISLNEVGGDVRARTQNGPIRVLLAGARWEGAGLDAETANGPISLSVPEGYSARLEAGTTRGPMRTDIPLQVTFTGRDVRHVETVLGAGGPPVRVVTRNGPITIRAR